MVGATGFEPPAAELHPNRAFQGVNTRKTVTPNLKLSTH